LELRPIRPEEQRAYITLLRRAFGSSLPTDEELAVGKETLEFDRTLAAFDGRQVVGTAGIFSYEMTVPGGSLPCGGVTRVAVAATHRRRGLLTAMMRRQMDDMHERGEPLAALYASEAPIYGRFGYGLATYQSEIELPRSRGAFAKPLSASGRVVMADVPTAVEAFTRVWAEVHPMQPGMLALDARWWRNLLVDLEILRQGFSPQYRVVYEVDGKPAGFALYRIKMDWDSAGPIGSLRLESLIATTAEAYAALWRYILGVDLVATISASMRPVDEPLRFLLADSRLPKTTIEDGIWLRLVDVGRALAGRRYAAEGRLVLRIRDAFCPWNDGHFELNGGPSNAECKPCPGNPDLELSAADLAAVYLGGNRFHALNQAGRIQEIRHGAVALADAMFATDRAPWCPSHF
jgi:predicted acetyltransferase